MAMATAHSGSAWILQGSTIRSRSARWGERRHREPEAGQLLPVELGPLLVAGPHDRLAGGVDRVRHRLAALERDARDGARERERDAVERVVVVVPDDHEPRLARARARPGPTRLLLACGRRNGRHSRIVPLLSRE